MLNFSLFDMHQVDRKLLLTCILSQATLGQVLESDVGWGRHMELNTREFAGCNLD